MIRNLGKVLGIVVKSEVSELLMHEDLAAFHAPGECHDDVRRGEAERFREARKHAEAEAQRPWRCIVREAKKRGVEFAGSRYDRIYARIYDRVSPWGQR